METRRLELGRLRKQRAELQRKLDGLDRVIGKIEGGGRMGGGSRARNSKSLNDTLEEVLSNGKPMSVGDIVEAVKAAGYRSSSANFRGIVNQTLIKENKRFAATERGVYQLKK